MSDAGWEHFEHRADIGLRAWGPDLASALEQAALALTGVVTEPEAVAPSVPVALECEAADAEFLLVEWLDSLIYAMATRRMLFGAFEVAVGEGWRLSATAWGEPVDRERHQPAVEVKGTTLTGLSAERDAGGGWRLACVVDV